MSEMPMDGVVVDFCGERHPVSPDRPFYIGRAGDLVLDEDNLHLHRRFLEISWSGDFWVIRNVGDALAATLSSKSQPVQAWLGPGVALPLVFADSVVRFTAGTTSYEVDLQVPAANFTSTLRATESDAGETIGALSISPEQRLLVVALAEPMLRSGRGATVTLPTNAEASARLGWALTKFNRKLDAVCQTLTKAGIRGLHGGPARLASDRRTRLVEYALGVQLVTPADLALLDRHTTGGSGPH